MWTAIHQLILSLSVITGAVVAWRGLSTWRDQLHGQAQHKLAIQVLTATLKYRDAIRSARFPGSTFDMKADDREKQEMSPREWLCRARQRDYIERWNRIATAHSVVETELIEAEIVWGKPCLDLFKTLWKLEDTLYGAFLKQIDLDDPENTEKISPEERQRIRRTIYRRKDDDEIDPELEKAIGAIKKCLAPYINSGSTRARIRESARVAISWFIKCRS